MTAPRRRFLPLGHMLTAGAVFTLLLTWGVVSLLSLRHDLADIEAAAQLGLTRDLTLLQGQVEYLVARQDLNRVQQLLAEWGARPETETATLSDERGIILAARRRETIGRPVRARLAETLAVDGVTNLDSILATVRQSRSGNVFLTRDRAHVLGVYPVLLGRTPDKVRPQRVGVLIIQESLERRAALTRHQAAIRAAGLLAGLLVVGAGVLGVIRQLLIRRLARLTATARRLGAGDLDARASLGGRDELTQLGETFDTMAERIRRSQRDLERREEATRMILESSMEAVLTMNHEGTVTRWTGQAARIFGWEAGEILGRRLEDTIIPPEAKEAHLTAVRRRTAPGAPPFRGRRLEVEGLTRSGARIPVELAITQTIGVEGVTFHAFLRDLSDQRRVEAAYQGLVDSIEGVVWEADAATLRHTFVSRQIERLLGYPAEAWTGDAGFWERCLHPEDVSEAVAHRRGAVAGGRGGAAQYRLMARDGRAVWVRDLVSVVARDGTVTALRGILIDITEHRRLEEHLAQAEKMESVGRLAGGIAHDFNNLLTAILGAAELARDGLSPDDRRAVDLDAILSASRKAADLTNRLLAFARKQTVQPKRVSLPGLLSQLEPLLRRLIGEHIALTLGVEPGAPPVLIDAAQLEQVILNVVLNARDAMPEGGRLAVAARAVVLGPEDALRPVEAEPGRWVLIEVSDTGSGMSEEVRARIFEPFFTTKEIGKGTGLGLATSYGAIRQAGGHITATSEPGRGAIFRIYLPPAQGSTEVAVPPSPSTAPVDGPGGTVLVVEDESMLLRLATRILRQAGYEVLSGGSGLEGMELAERYEGRIDALVTDVVMPGMSGVELAERLTAARPGLRVLFMSGYADDVLARHRLAATDVRLLEKPFLPADLTRRVRELLETTPA